MPHLTREKIVSLPDDELLAVIHSTNPKGIYRDEYNWALIERARRRARHYNRLNWGLGLFLLVVLAVILAPAYAKASDLDNAKIMLEVGLRDYASAQFKKVELHRSGRDGRLAVCGIVNAKNAYGGYTGYKRFFQIEGLAQDVEPSNPNWRVQETAMMLFENGWSYRCSDPNAVDVTAELDAARR